MKSSLPWCCFFKTFLSSFVFFFFHILELVFLDTQALLHTSFKEIVHFIYSFRFPDLSIFFSILSSFFPQSLFCWIWNFLLLSLILLSFALVNYAVGLFILISFFKEIAFVFDSTEIWTQGLALAMWHEPHLQTFCFVFQIESQASWASLCLHHSWDYRCVPPHPSSFCSCWLLLSLFLFLLLFLSFKFVDMAWKLIDCVSGKFE
jgi:hypothetical protein